MASDLHVSREYQEAECVMTVPAWQRLEARRALAGPDEAYGRESTGALASRRPSSVPAITYFKHCAHVFPLLYPTRDILLKTLA